MADDQQADGKSDGRPAFAREFPRDPELDALVAAFEAGNFARVRGEAARVIASSADDAVKRAAQTLLARTKPDPMSAWLVGITALLLVALSAWWMTHDGPR